MWIQSDMNLHERLLSGIIVVGYVSNLEGKLEFLSYLALVLVPHWIGDGRLSNIYTNSSHVYCYECWVRGHIPTRVRARRTGPGCVRMACVLHDLRTGIQSCGHVGVG